MPALPSWLTEPLWDQFAALLPERPAYADTHPLGCHRGASSDRIIFDKIIQILVFGCGYRKAADETCSATTLRDRRDEWIELGVFEQLELIALQAYDRIVGLALRRHPGRRLPHQSLVRRRMRRAKPSGPAQRRTQALHRDRRHGHPARRGGRAPATDTTPRCSDPTLDRLDRLGPLPEQATVHLDAAYGTVKGRKTAAEHGLLAEVAVKGIAAPIQNTKRWPVERTNAWGNQFFKIARCTERRTE